ncbi:diadenylate cyclase CdaA [Bdellovibrionota bacterium]
MLGPLEFFVALRWNDYLDIFLLFILTYRLVLLIRGTRSAQILIGLGLLLLVFFLSQWLQLFTIHWVFSRFGDAFIIALVILFQDDIRRALAHVGRNPFFTSVPRIEETKIIDELVKAAVLLSQRKVGALIAIEREIGLKNYIEVGTKIDSHVNAELVVSLFLPYSPLHDGALILQAGRLTAAGCFLPLTVDPNVKKTLGTRHRAAIGLTEETDAVVIVVSEETTEISLAFRGKLKRGLDGPTLRGMLLNLFKVVPE